MEDVNDLCSRMAIDDPTEGGMVFDENDVPEDAEELRWCLIGRFMTDTSLHFMSMHNTFAAVWKPVKGMFFRDLGQNCYLFQFFHEKDVLRVESGGPWTFDRHLLLFRRLGVHEKPMVMPLFEFSIWLQVYDLPIGFRSEKVCATIGNYAGKFMESDVRNFDGSFRDFVRIRILQDVRVPLKQQMKMKRKGGEWFYAKFQFERLPSFCFYCGLIGHSVQFCEKTYDDPTADSNPIPYDPGLRASNRKNTIVDGSRWIRQSGGRSESSACGGYGEAVIVDSFGDLQGKKVGNPFLSGQVNNMIGSSYNMEVNAVTYGKLDSQLNADLHGNLDSYDGAIILDTKRKRVDATTEVVALGSEALNPLPIMDKTLPKNLLEVGLVHGPT